MLSIAIFTYKRIDALKKCLNSIIGDNIGEILIFNDDETQRLRASCLTTKHASLRVFNPSDFGFSGRMFRKPIFINKAVELAKYNKILLSDDDGIFAESTVKLHHKYLEKYKFVAGTIIRDKYFNRKSKTILQGTNYSFHKDFFNQIGGYNEDFSLSSGGGDPEFWYRVYHFVKENNIPVAYINSAVQRVLEKQSRDKNNRKTSPIEVFERNHGFKPKGKMYKWFIEIRKKSNWMEII